MGVRIFSLAKELDMSSKELMAYLQTQGHVVKNHMCTIPDPVAQILRDRLPKRVAATKAAAAKVAPANGGPGAAVAATRAPAPAAPQVTPRPSIVGKAKPVTPAASAPVAPKPAAPPPAPPQAAPAIEEEPAEKEPREEKRAKGDKEAHPARKRVFPGSPDFGMDVMASSRLAGLKRGIRKLEPPRRDGAPAAPAPEKRAVSIELPVTVKGFSAATGVKVADIITRLMKPNRMPTINDYLDEQEVQSLATQLGVEVRVKKESDIEEEIRAIESYVSPPENLVPRAPVVTFMGHVDHGKTSLLDKIRKTNITQKESGGITQHLGAYRVDKGDVHVVFIDTPGHKAFTEMRARGANITDVVVLVVAADDGPMPQTEEAINHARAANVKIVVALNKIDRPNANPNRCRDLLAKLGLNPVEWGGSTEIIEVSALTSHGIDHLLEVVSLESQILDLKADPQRPAIGTVLDAESSTSRGIIATVLVQDGTLRQGDHVLCGLAHGRVRGIWLNGTEAVSAAGPAMPVQISGLSEAPDAGDRLYVLADPQAARRIADERARKRRESERADRQKITLENLFAHLEASEVKEVRLVLKTDVKGSLEVLRKALTDLSGEEVKVKIIHSGVGGISQEDVVLADASQAIVVGFHVVADDRARVAAEDSRVDIRTYQVIYELLDDVKKAMEAQIAPERREMVKGHLKIQQVFKASRLGNIAGCRVTHGTIARTDKVRLVREGRVIYSGEISSLKRFKDDVREVKEGFECGLKISNYEDIKEGDVVESYAIVEEKRNL